MWHFSKLDKKLGYTDGRIIRSGTILKVDGPVLLCQRGLHASSRIIDALRYSPGPYIWNVELSGKVIHGDDKSVGTERKALWGYDATKVLKAFSRRVALDAVRQFWQSDKFGEFPKIALDWLETGNEEIKSEAAWAARSSAESAAESAAWAARSAAESVAWAAESAASAAKSAAKSAESAAWAVVRSAAESAESAARSAAESAAWAAAKSAESVAWAAVRSAAWAQNEILEKMIIEAYPRRK